MDTVLSLAGQTFLARLEDDTTSVRMNTITTIFNFQNDFWRPTFYETQGETNFTASLSLWEGIPFAFPFNTGLICLDILVCFQLQVDPEVKVFL